MLLEWKMPHCNILIGCDQVYYNNWGINLLKSIQYFNPWVKLHCHIVNPNDHISLKFVDYTYEDISFPTEDCKISYLQACRFLIANKKFKKNDIVMTLDADTICTKSFDRNNFLELFKKNTVLQHPKDGRWLAGLVCLGSGIIRSDFSNMLLEEPLETWLFGRDQLVLEKLSQEYNFGPVSKEWISIGKNGLGSVFLTLKGNQKYTEKYLSIYENYKNHISCKGT